jgi:Tfp pilus assembly protein PilO
MDTNLATTRSTTPTRTSFSGSVFELIFLLIIIFLGYWYLVLPKSDEYSGFQDQLKNLQARRTEINAQQKVFDVLVQDLNAQTDNLTALDDMLPLDAKPSRLYLLMESIMQRAGLGSGVVSIEIDPQTPVAGNAAASAQSLDSDRTVKTIGINVSGTGTIDQLDNLLHLLESSGRVLQVQGMDISQGRGEQLIFRLTLHTYSYVPGTPGAVSGAPNIAPSTPGSVLK